MTQPNSQAMPKAFQKLLGVGFSGMCGTRKYGPILLSLQEWGQKLARKNCMNYTGKVKGCGFGVVA